MERTKPKALWNVEQITADMALRGWNTADLAREAGVAFKTIDRFLNGQVQTNKTATKIADAFGYKTVRRYFAGVEAIAS